jgi:hypothetical protein
LARKLQHQECEFTKSPEMIQEILTMKKAAARILLILLVLTLTALACVGGGGDQNGSSSDTGTSAAGHQPMNAQATMSAGATATYGAEQFHLQLTAIAEQKLQP